MADIVVTTPYGL